MKDIIIGLLGTIAICAVIIAVVFGLLGELVGLDFAVSIACFAGSALVLSIYGMVVVFVLGFDWTEDTLVKLTGAGILMAVLSNIVFMILEWVLFYNLFVIFAVVAAVTTVVGLIKLIFFN